ncbi:Gfo/Idh/MocA family protein [Paenibacillus sp. 22594]|uniref:Gfo/Idh/MocA family protein n=1 Tax=Paenibacillus sp. 22594 TaxID=3453947 RepID=UPI003F867BC6
MGDVIGTSAFVVCPSHEWFHPNYQPEGGPLMDVGPYYITAILLLLGPIARVSCLANHMNDDRKILTGPRQG